MSKYNQIKIGWVHLNELEESTDFLGLIHELTKRVAKFANISTELRVMGDDPDPEDYLVTTEVFLEMFDPPTARDPRVAAAKAFMAGYMKRSDLHHGIEE